MEFLIGVLVSGVLLNLAYFVFNKIIIKNEPIRVKVTQSRSHALVYKSMAYTLPKRKMTQSIRHLESTHMRVFLTEEYAYWIKNNAVYRAQIINGKIIDESAETLDIMGMDKVQLNEIMFIIEKLTEGKNNDYWSSGDSKF